MAQGWGRYSTTHLRAGKGNLQTWRYRIGKAGPPSYRFCILTSRGSRETGEHAILDCPHWEKWRTKKLTGRRGQSADFDLKVWVERMKEGSEEDIDRV